MDREYQASRGAEDSWISSHNPQVRDAGRSTLSDSLDGESGSPSLYSGSSIFAMRATAALPEETAPEVAGAPPAPQAEAADDHTPPSPADAVDVTNLYDENDLERIYGDNKDQAHRAPFERSRSHAEKHHAKQDKYNKASIKSDKISHDVAARPGVVVHNGKHRDGIFSLQHAHATRYLYVKRGNERVAEPYDVVDRNELANYNYKKHHKKQDNKGRIKRLLLNPSQPRELMIKGQPVMCVLTWIDGMTAAWLPVDEIKGSSRAHILGAVRARASHWDPARVSEDPHEIQTRSKRYVIRNDAVGQGDRFDDPVVKHGDKTIKKPRVLDAGAKGGNNVSHYLDKDIRKPSFDAQGNARTRMVGKGGKKHEQHINVTRSVVALSMNLPGPDEPPIAIDTAEAGQSFFVMRAKSFHREVPVFANGAHDSQKLQMWVFGHLAMRDANGKLVPDPQRRGWLPLRTLADAGHLETHDIPQRKPKT